MHFQIGGCSVSFSWKDEEGVVVVAVVGCS